MADARENGFRYYHNSLFLFVWTDGLGGLNTKWQELPDTTKKMVATPQQFMASLESTYDFDKGVLKSTRDVGDATTVPKAILAAASELLPLAMNKVNQMKTHGIDGPRVYKVELYGDAVHFVGEDTTDTIRVPLRAKGSS